MFNPEHCEYVYRFLVVGGPIHPASLSPHHDTGIGRRLVTVTLLPCPSNGGKHGLATFFPYLMDKNDYPSFFCQR